MQFNPLKRREFLTLLGGAAFEKREENSRRFSGLHCIGFSASQKPWPRISN